MFRPGISLPGTGAAREQPRPVEDVRSPGAAERVRTLVESSVSAVLAVPGTEEGTGTGLPGGEEPGRRTVTPGGDIVFRLPAASVAVRVARSGEIASVMELTDVAPVAVPHRIRGRARIAGWLSAAAEEDCPAVPGTEPGAWVPVRLEVGEAHIDDLWGAEHVEPDEFAGAAADPLVTHEAALLQHLDSSHADLMNSLGSLLGAADGEFDRAVPLALDRHGIRVRFCGEGGLPCFDARFEFPEPVGSMDRLRRAVHRLFEAADEERERLAVQEDSGTCAGDGECGGAPDAR